MNHASPDLDVLVLGGAGVDTIVYTPDLPLPYADSYMVPAITTRAGHTGDAVALGLHALGLRTHHLDAIGDDHEGELVRRLHERHGVPFTALPSPGGTKRAVNLVGPDGRRLSLYDVGRGDGTADFPADLLDRLTAATRHVHVSITHPGANTLARLADSEVTVSTDLHNWDGHNPYHEAFALAADVVFLSAAALDDPEPVLRRIIEQGRARVVVATAGADGGHVLERGATGPVRFAAVAPPAPVVDSNGAGDAFVSGFLYGWLSGAPTAESVRFATLCGAHACTVPATEMAPLDLATLRKRAGADATG
ncbi:ribokinase [Catellatospora sp. TT07R-123]|uniref:PfkB family carbohydrate kinase n=1 Tax=Catellatospora sp. TT07R-123 TaxID=2733863 RepID=UPI001B2408C8|nr:PfkB family carbohydrate kinase [Catellatospora sp. TT07R-123]GHJ48685.1 ribokinase [Catellatospora sp. TT07R-123]